MGKNQEWESSSRYPDPNIVALHPSFTKYMIAHSAIERLYAGTRHAEGPVWFGLARCLLWSDVPNDRILRWDELTGEVAAYRSPCNNANGNTRDRQGRLVTCEHGGQRVTRTEHDGRITVVAHKFNGHRLNSPNDIVVASDGAIWFTDPPFGHSLYEGHVEPPKLPPSVYRVDPRDGSVNVVLDDIPGPNGLAFSPDEKTLYVVDSRAKPPEILAFDVIDGHRLGRRRKLIDSHGGKADGLRVDIDGNLWCGWGMGDPDLDGVRIFNPEGEPIGQIRLPERCANVCFGGFHRNRLFMAASRGLYSLYVNTQGVAGG